MHRVGGSGGGLPRSGQTRQPSVYAGFETGGGGGGTISRAGKTRKPSVYAGFETDVDI